MYPENIRNSHSSDFSQTLSKFADVSCDFRSDQMQRNLDYQNEKIVCRYLQYLHVDNLSQGNSSPGSSNSPIPHHINRFCANLVNWKPRIPQVFAFLTLADCIDLGTCCDQTIPPNTISSVKIRKLVSQHVKIGPPGHLRSL